MCVSFINKEINYILNKKTMNCIQNGDQHHKAWHSLFILFIGGILFITLHSFMSDDGVRLHVEASVVSVSSSLVFLGNSVQ